MSLPAELPISHAAATPSRESPLRQTAGWVNAVHHFCGLAWAAPDFSTWCRRQLDWQVQIPYTCSQAGLHLLLNQAGFGGAGWLKRC
ncbi:transposase [Comamonas sp.]|uniref:transposase n=1 Tax=Comamonas sp. TaxID=34028 RepID=UPI00339038F4